MDPLTLRELRGLSRRGTIYLSRAIYVGIIGIALALWWFSNRDCLRLLSPSQAALLGRQLFNGLVIFQMVLLGIGSTLGGADMLLKELRSRTLAMIVSTPLTGVAIVWAKWKATMVQTVTLMLCGLPGLAVCAYLGAIGPWEMAWSICLTLALASIGAALGLRKALTCRTTAGATMRAIFEFAAVGVVLSLLRGVHPVFDAAMTFLYPLGALAAVTTWSGLIEFGWISSTVACFLTSLWLIRRTGHRVLDLGGRAEEPDPDLTEDRGLLVAGAAVRSWVTETRVWDDQPLLWKELATRPGARLEPYFGKPLIWTTVLILVAMWLVTGGRAVEFLAPALAVVLGAVVIQGAGLFTRDRETRWNEMVLCTPLSDAQLLRAKLLAGLIAPEAVFVLAVGLVVFLGWSLPSGLLTTLLSLATTALFFFFAYLAAALSSLLVRTMRNAFLWSAGSLALLLLAFPVQSVWLEWPVLFGRGRDWRLQDCFASLNPIIYLHSCRHSDVVAADKPFQAALCFSVTYGVSSMMLLGLIAWTFRRQRAG
jgi:ABC-type transport system involved in multi-copper enzyme maturation permease subunit